MDKPENVYDIVVIGSGIGGLTFASLMSQLAGKRVLVLERHFKAGGYTHTFDRKGYTWDVGVHYIGQMDRGERCRQLFDLVSQGGVDWCRMPDKLDIFHYPDFSFAVDADPEVYKADLIKLFPQESVALCEYFEDMKRVAQWFERQALLPMLALPLSWVLRLMDRGTRALAVQTTQKYLDKKFKSPELKALLCSQWGDFGLPPSKSPFALHVMVVCHYFGGGYYPRGSARTIADAIIPVIKARGGDCLVNHKVESIIVENGQARGVRVLVEHGGRKEEKTFLAPLVVSDAGYAITFGSLVPAEYRVAMPAQVSDQIRSTTTLYIGFKSSPEKLGFKGENHWLFDNYDHNLMFDNTLAQPGGSAGGCFLSFPSLKDPAATKHTAEISAVMKYEDFARWQDTKWKRRGQDYETYKQQLEQVLLNVVESRFPGFSELIEYKELSTPLTICDFTGHQQGAIYGYPLTPEVFSQRTFHPGTTIKNLYLTGTDVVALGVMGAFMGGVVTASHAMGGLPGFLKIMKAAGNS